VHLFQNAQVWCNYGYLCLTQNDHDLANRAFSKAQVIEPENAWAWLGQALVAYRDNDTKEALSLFEQASTLSAGNLVSTDGPLSLVYGRQVLMNDVRSYPADLAMRLCSSPPPSHPRRPWTTQYYTNRHLRFHVTAKIGRMTRPRCCCTL
jgi:tetratricopeptide (TPR) repeat protein